MSESARSRKRPWLAVVLAFLYPGLGHVYLREWLRALLWFALVVTSSTLLIPESVVPSTVSLGAIVEMARSLPLEAAVAMASITLFSMIDAYWMAKRSNRDPAVKRGSADADAAEDLTTCPSCGKDVDPDLDFCHWCTEPIPGRGDADADAE